MGCYAVGLQRKCACGGKAERECGACTVSRKPFHAPAAVGDVVSSPGRALDAATQSAMGAPFHFDFRRVRVHDDTRAAASAEAVSALAYTVGRHLVFGAGQYAPGTSAGRRLIAHELAHVVQQQRAGATSVQAFTVGVEHDADERQADAVAAAVMNGAALPALGAVGARLQRVAISSNERFLDLGNCHFLACNDVNACPDDANGETCDDGTTKATKKTGHKFSRHVRCDPECNKEIVPCNDADLELALPSGRFTMHKCNQQLTLCANGKSVTATVRERSDKNSWEASPAVAKALGVEPDFDASIYPEPNDPEMKDDRRCHPKPKHEHEPKKHEPKKAES